VLLVRDHPSTEDIAGIAVADGLLTASGGRTSHAAVVARQLDKVCVVGCDALSIDASHRRCRLGDVELAEGDVISLDGSNGAVYAGNVPVVRETPQALLQRVAAWRAAAGSSALPLA
jgi:pyruvate,orthophosphate dikinase